MAMCRYCDQEMSVAESCSSAAIVIGSVPYEPAPYGTEPGGKRVTGRCGDCGVARGAVHHHGCDVERCPRCGGQSISCGCVWAGEEHLTDEWVDEMDERLGASTVGGAGGQ
jgi:hypothetical protein